MTSRLPALQSSTPRKRLRGVTLLEVMIASGLLAFVGLSLITLFIQNFRMSKLQSFRTQAVTTSLSVLEQIRFLQYPEVRTIYNLAGTGRFAVDLPDPAAATGYTRLLLPINVRDGTLLTSTWTTANISVEPTTTAPTLPMRFFVTLNRNQQTTGTQVDLFEVVVMYQWLKQGRGTSAWQTGNVRLIIPRMEPMT